MKYLSRAKILEALGELARLLLSKMAGEKDEIWMQVEPLLVPGRELKGRYAFEDLWESEHADPGANRSVDEV